MNLSPIRSALVLVLAAGAAVAAPMPEKKIAPTPAAELATSPLMQAVENLAARAENPERERINILARLRGSPACYAPDLTPEEYEDLLERTHLLPAGIEPGGLRFFVDTPVWLGEGLQGPSGTARAANLTYSFPDDGVTWGLTSVGFGTAPNSLNAMFATIFGASNVDRGRELIRQSLASWARSAGLRYREVADDNTPMTASTTRVATRGDIRIGGFPLVNGAGVLAYNVFPGQGGDMAINTNYAGDYSNSFGNYRYLRNVIAHEHGHGLACFHVVPCNNVFLMEPSIHFNVDTLSNDEKRAGGRNYGDRFSGNVNAANAKDFGDLTTPILRSVIERDLSINGLNGALGSGSDWFRFTLSSAQPVSITVTPTGGTYIQGAQAFGCSGSTASVNASQAGNLNIELRDAVGTTIIQSAASAGAGQTETLSVPSLPAGTYHVRVVDAGPNPAANQIVQLYDLVIRVNTAQAPPQAIAGIDKRCRAGTICWFMGNLNSRATEIGATIPSPGGYDWDLDGDGVFETLDTPQPTRIYVSNGVYPVTLRVTDSNNRQGFHTINVTVFGATTTVTSVAPFSGEQGQTVPFTLTGTNLRNVTDASMVTVSGTGVTVTGTPVPNAMGTEVTGLSFVIASNAPVGYRDITVSNDDGSATGLNLFYVLEGAGCPADWDGNGTVNSTDISAFLTAWLDSLNQGNLDADFDGNGQVNSTDISAFLSAWLQALEGC